MIAHVAEWETYNLYNLQKGTFPRVYIVLLIL